MKTLELERPVVGVRGMYLAGLLLLSGCDAFATVRGHVYGTDDPALNGFRIVSQGQMHQVDPQEMWPLEGVTCNNEFLESSAFEIGIKCEHFSRVVWMEFSKDGYRTETLEIRMPEDKELQVILLFE